MAKLLLGFMGSGKTTIAQLLDDNFLDMDHILVERLRMPISQYFSEKGEAAFRQVESQLLEELLKEDAVISTGGGIVMAEANRKLLTKNACNIYLQADFESLYERLAADQKQERPLFLSQTKEDLRQLYDYRCPFYEEVASQIIPVAGKSPEEIVEIIRCS